MEFNLLRKISAYTVGIFIFIKIFFDSYFWSIWIYFKYIQKDYKKLQDRKIKKLENISNKSHIFAFILFILAIILWWEVLVYYATPAS
ncbi:MAG: hypothetical protein WC839_00130 [Candidatus Paceibacterota bacterium]